MGGWGIFPTFLREIWFLVMHVELVSLSYQVCKDKEVPPTVFCIMC